MKASLITIVLALTTLACDRAAPPGSRSPTDNPSTSPQPQSLPTIEMKLGNSSFRLMVADDDDERATGLMHRRNMAADEGMIFCFPYEAPRGFWMKNTPIDLDIIYLDRHAKIVSIHTMRAYSTNTTPSDGDAMYAIELNAGRAAEIGMSVGVVLDIPPAVRASAR